MELNLKSLSRKGEKERWSLKKGGGLRVWEGMVDKWQEPGRVWEEEKGRSSLGREEKGVRR